MFSSVQQGSRYIISMILVSLHTKSSSIFHAEFVYKLFSPTWRILTMKTLSYKLRRLSICSFDQITSQLFSPFQSCFIYHVLTMPLDIRQCGPQAMCIWERGVKIQPWALLHLHQHPVSVCCGIVCNTGWNYTTGSKQKY
jgi:hypothetical protein